MLREFLRGEATLEELAEFMDNNPFFVILIEEEVCRVDKIAGLQEVSYEHDYGDVYKVYKFNAKGEDYFLGVEWKEGRTREVFYRKFPKLIIKVEYERKHEE